LSVINQENDGDDDDDDDDERSGSWQGRFQTSAEDAFIYTVLKHLPY